MPQDIVSDFLSNPENKDLLDETLCVYARARRKTAKLSTVCNWLEDPLAGIPDEVRQRVCSPALDEVFQGIWLRQENTNTVLIGISDDVISKYVDCLPLGLETGTILEGEELNDILRNLCIDIDTKISLWTVGRKNSAQDKIAASRRAAETFKLLNHLDDAYALAHAPYGAVYTALIVNDLISISQDELCDDLEEEQAETAELEEELEDKQEKENEKENSGLEKIEATAIADIDTKEASEEEKAEEKPVEAVIKKQAKPKKRGFFLRRKKEKREITDVVEVPDTEESKDQDEVKSSDTTQPLRKLRKVETSDGETLINFADTFDLSNGTDAGTNEDYDFAEIEAFLKE